ncbi:MAG: hypothetical protein WC979_03110 [Candidatus Pacearchaeota archaeon]|jgi:cation transport regulator ChaB|nr:hypothetical protein [Clostridia bacterium]
MENINEKIAKHLVTKFYNIIFETIDDIEGTTANNQAWEAAKKIAIEAVETQEIKDEISKL